VAALLLTAFRESSNFRNQESYLQALGGIWPVSDRVLAEVVQITSYEVEPDGSYHLRASNIRHDAVEVLAYWSREHSAELMAALRRIGAFGLQADPIVTPELHLFPTSVPIDESAEVVVSPSDEAVGI